MNLILLHPEDYIGAAEVRLSGRRAEHICTVHRALPGDVLKVGMVNGGIGIGTVKEIAPTTITLTVIWSELPPPPLPVTAIIALPRPKTFKKVLQAGAAAGVKNFIFINCWKVEKSYWNSPLLNPDGIAEQLTLGLEQGVDTAMPQIAFRRLFKPFVEDELPGLLAGKVPLLAHPAAAEECPCRLRGEAVICLGPEGGFTDYEVAALKAAGLMPVTLGRRVLRTEFALCAILGRLF